MKRAGLCSVTFRNKSVEEVIALAKAGGLDCIEWGGDIHVPPQDTAHAAKVGRLTRESGLETLSYGSYFKCHDGEDFAPVSEAAQALGAPVIRIWAGGKGSAETAKEEYEALVNRARACAKIARRKGQTVAFEYHGGTYTDNSESALRLVKDIGEDNVCLYWQPAYWCAAPSDEAFLRENLWRLRLIEEYLIGVHVYQWRGYNRFPLSDGAQEWENYFVNSNAAFYNLEFVKEDSELQFLSDAAVLREAIRRK